MSWAEAQYVIDAITTNPQDDSKQFAKIKLGTVHFFTPQNQQTSKSVSYILSGKVKKEYWGRLNEANFFTGCTAYWLHTNSMQPDSTHAMGVTSSSYNPQTGTYQVTLSGENKGNTSGTSDFVSYVVVPYSWKEE